ncbi:MAG: NADH-quinone oxidoreductase subunit A [Candidatus Thalassarchaeaceae archaeon]|nr:NADH-quinone oxidoreductase subunit A [Candidatus Thalassarchaeaceae archaeon]
MRLLTSIPADYLAVGLMAIVGFLFPFGGFVTSYFLRPTRDPNDPTKMRSILIPGLESDQSLYVRRLSTYECGSDPVGDARIEFHFQYYWYAIIFLVFDIAFMFLSFAGILVSEATTTGGSEVVTIDEALGGLVSLTAIFGFMVLGIWYVFRKRGRIYI